ncbi:transglycosylase domain-containing protein, partial [Streptomyces sp. GC420]|uniref:transglycosylase domain-containing protein n=1 Tax=Streptomyces sp. GC420 TaxID=2697568 RepID=UPI0037D9D5FE
MEPITAAEADLTDPATDPAADPAAAGAAAATEPGTALATAAGPTPPPPPTGPPGAPRTGRHRLVPGWRTVLGGFLLLCLLLGGGFLAGYVLVDIPPANATAVAQSNVFLYADGTQLARDGEVNRENVRLSRIPKDVQQAVLAAEDRDFYSESAVDPQAMVRAAWNTVTGKGRQSGSTITQQYVKNYYLGQEQTVTRKAKEFFIAIKLDQQVGKADILEGYLNTSYFGRSAYGIQAAAHAYYGEDVEDLDAAQGAYLAALLNAPGYYDVAAHPQNRARALARWNYVLDGMVKEHWLSASERAAMEFPEPKKVKPAAGLSGQRGYIVEAVKDYLTARGVIDERTLATGGYRITTTLVKKRQDALVEAVDDQVYEHLDPEARPADRNVRAGAASIDPDTGKVVAMYGGVDYTRQYVNNATRHDYQVGSTFKPFVFASAVDLGSTTQDGKTITPNTIYDGTNKRMVEGFEGPTGYAPENEDDVSYGPIPVTVATDRSVNAVYAQMAQDVGPANVRRTALALGISKDTPDLTASPSIALGVATASVLDMTEAYATLANHGVHHERRLVQKISKGGEELPLPRHATATAVSREAADTTTDMLVSVVENGTGAGAALYNRFAAGKTGTAEEDRAAWFAGYTPELATVVAVMGQDPETGVQKSLYGALGLSRINGGGQPARIWKQYTANALKGLPVHDFELDIQEGARHIDPSDEAYFEGWEGHRGRHGPGRPGPGRQQPVRPSPGAPSGAGVPGTVTPPRQPSPAGTRPTGGPAAPLEASVPPTLPRMAAAQGQLSDGADGMDDDVAG